MISGSFAATEETKKLLILVIVSNTFSLLLAASTTLWYYGKDMTKTAVAVNLSVKRAEQKDIFLFRKATRQYMFFSLFRECWHRPSKTSFASNCMREFIQELYKLYKPVRNKTITMELMIANQCTCTLLIWRQVSHLVDQRILLSFTDKTKHSRKNCSEKTVWRSSFLTIYSIAI